MNEIIIEGRLAQNPEKKQAKTGTTMTTFNVASDRMMDKGNIDYFHCISFGQTADYVQQYGATGMAIIVIGECQLSNYTDKNGHKQTGIWRLIMMQGLMRSSAIDGASGDIETYLSAMKHLRMSQ